MELKNCPFCGSAADIYDNCSNVADEFWAQCQNKENCFAIGTAEPSFDSAVKAWNSRQIEDTLRARLEAAEAYIQAMEDRESVEAQPECFPDEEAYEQSQDDAFHAVCKAREAWEKAKGNGRI